MEKEVVVLEEEEVGEGCVLRECGVSTEVEETGARWVEVIDDMLGNRSHRREEKVSFPLHIQ